MTEWARKHVLVTGGSGFIGSHLVDLLVRAGAHVTVLDLNDSADLIAEAELVKADLRGPVWFMQCNPNAFDVIFHFAANAYVPPSVHDPVFDFDTNMRPTLDLLDALRRHRWDGKLVFASSAAVYGNPAILPVREGDPTAPVSPYGVGKLAAERYCDVYAKLYGLKIASLRLFSCYGPRHRKQVVYDLMTKIKAMPIRSGTLNMHGDGTQERDFCYVTDAARAAMLVAEKADMRGEVYNVASGQPVSIRELAMELCHLMDVTPVFAWTGTNRPGDPEKLVVSIDRLRELGYKPQFDLRKGLEETVTWFRGL